MTHPPQADNGRDRQRTLRQRLNAEIGRVLTCACDFGEQDNYPLHAPCRKKVLDAVLAVENEELERLRREVAKLLDRLDASGDRFIRVSRRAEAAEATLTRIRDRHHPGDTGTGRVCMDCGRHWPCPTRRIVDDKPEDASLWRSRS